MPGKVKVKICSGRNLPVMDRSSDTTDAYVEIKLGNITYKTDVCRKSLHPQWNTDWYRFEVDDSELQDEPLQIRLMDHDTYSANDAIGKVYLNLNPLLLPADIQKYGSGVDNASHHEISGWIPVYDTMHGIRGEVNVVVKVELFSDFNRFRQSSCGVHFFYSPIVPQGFYAKVIHGFVEELVVNDDPEYQWIDKIRTPRASNEARQTLFCKLSGELQRKIGVKALNLGGNAVIGYKQSYDLEGESGIVARGIGTAVTLVKSVNICHSSTNIEDIREVEQNGLLEQSGHSPERQFIPNPHRRSSDSDLSITPKGGSLTGSDKSWGYTGSYYSRNNPMFRSQIHQENFDMLEYPFLTILKYSPGFIRHVGGTVSARSVKRLETITNLEEPESRDTWWSELRMEIRCHARALNCNAVLGYSEESSICDDVCVLSAYGTAAVINFQSSEEIEEKQKDSLTDKNERTFESPEHHNVSNIYCTLAHLPYDINNIQLKSMVARCNVCGVGKVPELLLATIEPPDTSLISGRGCLIDAYVNRPLKEQKGESVAKEISDGLPFLEYELHRLLINKLKIKGMNAIFGIKFNVSIGEKMIIGVVTGTAVYLNPLPIPSAPKLLSDRISDEKKLEKLQELVTETMTKNRDYYQIKDVIQMSNFVNEDDNLEENKPPSLDLSAGNKDCCVLEVDDPEDEELLKLLVEEKPPDGFHVVNTETVPGLDDLEAVKNLQFFTQLYRIKFQPPFVFNKHFRRLLQAIYFKLRRVVPCALCKMQFRVDVPEPDEIQLCVFGMAVSLDKKLKKLKLKKNEDETIFKLDEEIPENDVVIAGAKQGKYKQKSPLKHRSCIKRIKDRYGVDITPLSIIPGALIERYLGNLNFFFIRETTSIREEGGPNGFVHSFISEVLAIVRAQVVTLGGNALVSFFLNDVILINSPHKNQGQCLIHVGGDAVSVSYFKEEI